VNHKGAVHRLNMVGTFVKNEKRLVRLRLSHVSYDSVFYIRGISV
jgi:hypothetical protein